jgi:hypothetical protein
MRLLLASALGLCCLLDAAAASAQVAQVQLSYDTYAAGLKIMRMQAVFRLGPHNYAIDLNYQTTGLAGLFYRGHQVNAVHGVWHDNVAAPVEFSGDGVWHGRERRTLIDYDRGLPTIRELEPPQETEREAVPVELQRNTIDTLSALAQLMRRVGRDHVCETEVHTYDGRRVLDVVARTGGAENLDPGRSTYSGPSLRCDFEGREVAGFLFGEDDPEHRRPLHGSAWLAPLLPGAPPLPVRIEFQTRWFGVATMYLTEVTAAPEPR